MGIGARIMAWLPLPIVMGMFAGSIVDYVTRLVKATVTMRRSRVSQWRRFCLDARSRIPRCRR